MVVNLNHILQFWVNCNNWMVHTLIGIWLIWCIEFLFFIGNGRAPSKRCKHVISQIKDVAVTSDEHEGVTNLRQLDYLFNNNDVTMGAIASQITSLRIVFSTVYLDIDQRKHQSSASLAFVRGNHQRPVNSPHKWPVTRKMFPLMTSSYIILLYWSFSVCWVRARHLHI